MPVLLVKILSCFLRMKCAIKIVLLLPSALGQHTGHFTAMPNSLRFRVMFKGNSTMHADGARKCYSLLTFGINSAILQSYNSFPKLEPAVVH